MSNDGSVRGADVRAIRTAIVGLALAIMTAALIHSSDPETFWLLIVTLIVIAFSFVQTLLDL